MPRELTAARVHPLILALAIMLVPALAQDEDPTIKKTRSAQAALEAGRFDDALAGFKDAQIDRPEAVELDLDIGISSYKLGKFDDAVAALTKATRAKDQRVEGLAWFHLGNAFFRQGSLESALEAYNHALRVRPNDEDAKFNREVVVRHIKEKARQQKDEHRKQDIAQLLQKLIEAESGVARANRLALRDAGAEPPPVGIAQLEGALDVASESRPATPLVGDALTARSQQLREMHGEIEKGADALLQALKEELDSKPTSQPAQPPAQGEAEKFTKVRELVTDAREPLKSATGRFGAGDLKGAYQDQELALTKLLEALDILMDELSRIIRDQALVLTDTTKTAATLGIEIHLPESHPTAPDSRRSATPAKKPESAPDTRGLVPLHADTAAMLDPLATREDGLHVRTGQFTASVEQMHAQMKAAESQPAAQKPKEGQGPKPEDVAAAIKHLHAASGHLADAKDRLGARTVQPAFESEFSALKELVEAKKKLSPPSGGDQDQKQDQQKDQDQKQQDQKDQNDKDQKKQDPAGKKGDQNDKKDQKEMSKEEAQAILDRLKQQEKEYRDQKNARPKGAREAPVKKDW